MHFSHYKALPLQLAVDLVNSEDVVDQIDVLTVEAVQTLIDRSELGETVVVREGDLREVRQLRDQIRAVFHSRSVPMAVKRVNQIISRSKAVPFVGLHGSGPHMHVAPARPTPATWLGSTIGMGLADLVVRYGTDRFGVCSADDCRDVFIDVSRNHSRKHCSARCTNREGVRSYRRRASERG